ncbi:MAG: hypothetical protein NTW30_06045 [Candidatus Aenigmarchaeota archaeon]|nr:hypothetical protein [Candidatus Aenigmarchaeota archaeon]
MNKKLFTTSILVLFSLLLFQTGNALLIYLRPPMMTVRLNTSQVVQSSLYIANLNNITLKIDANVTGNITEVINIENPSFSIEPKTNTTLNFTTKSKIPGTYTGEITVNYITNITSPIALPAKITVYVSGKQPIKIEYPLQLIAGIIVILIIVALLIKKFVRVKRRGS